MSYRSYCDLLNDNKIYSIQFNTESSFIASGPGDMCAQPKHPSSKWQTVEISNTKFNFPHVLSDPVHNTHVTWQDVGWEWVFSGCHENEVIHNLLIKFQGILSELYGDVDLAVT